MNKLVCPLCGCDFVHIQSFDSVTLEATCLCDDCEKIVVIEYTLTNY